MPTRLPRPCRTPGCPGLTRAQDGWCDPCRATRARAYDQERGSSSSRGYDAAHRRWRKQVLTRDPICMTLYRPDGSPVWDAPAAQVEDPPPGWCRCWRSSEHADHIMTRRERPDLAYDLSNGRGRCASCHGRKTAMEDGRWKSRT